MDVLALIWVAWLLNLDVTPIPAGINLSSVSAASQAANTSTSTAELVQDATADTSTTNAREVASGKKIAKDIDSGLSQQLSGILADQIDWQLWAGTPKVSVEPVAAQSSTAGDEYAQDHYCMALSQIAATKTPVSGATSDSQKRYQLQVHGLPIGEVSNLTTAEQLATKLRRALQAPDWNAADLKPLLGHSFAAGSIHQEILFVVDHSMLLDDNNPAKVAIQWMNNLRVATGAKPLSFAEVQMLSHNLLETNQQFSGIASWYGPYFQGRKTATGETFDQNELTAAHPSLPFGTYLKVRNQLNGKTVVVRVNDRGPYVGDRSLDLSRAAAQCLGSEQIGVIPFTATVLKSGQPVELDEETLAAK